MDELFAAIGKTMFYASLLLIGAAGWIVAERLAIVPDIAVIEQSAMNVLQDGGYAR